MSEHETHSPLAGFRSERASRLTSRVAKLWHPKPPATGHRSVWAGITIALVLAGALASVLGARSVARSDADKTRLAFHLSSAEIASTLKLAIQHEEDLVVSTSAYG